MSRSPSSLCVLLAAILAAPAAPAARAADDPFDAPYARARGLVDASAFEPGVALLDSIARAARAAGRDDVAREAALARGEAEINVGLLVPAERRLRGVLAASEAAGDSLRARRSLGWIASALMGQGRWDEARAAYLRVIPMAERQRDSSLLGYAVSGLSWLRFQRGEIRPAHAGYGRALTVFRAIGDTSGELVALGGLGGVLLAMGDARGATTVFRDVVARTHARADRAGEARAWNNLGALEFERGDPAEAMAHWGRALALHRARGERRDVLPTVYNLASASIELGRWAAAESLLAEGRAESEAHGFREGVHRFDHLRGVLRREQGRTADAATIQRAVLAHADEAPPALRARALRELARSLRASGEPAAALAALRAESGRLGAGLPVRDAGEVAIEEARALLELGRDGEALARARAIDRDAAARGLDVVRLPALVVAARAARALGARDSALALLERAAALWEGQRAVPREAEWRAQRGAAGRAIYGDLAALALEHPADRPAAARARTAFDALQRFKARTLIERLRVPGGATGAVEPATLERLQREVLGDGEVLVDAFVGERASVLFVVDRTRCEAVPLPAADSLARRVGDFHDLVAGGAAADADAEALRGAAARALGERLLGPVAPMLAAARRVIVSPDGALNRLPFAALEVGGPEGVVRLADRELALAPSAAALAALRARPRAPGAAGAVLALAGVAGEGGRPLDGARAEARWLARRFANVTRADARRGPPEPSALAGHAVLHVAGHTRVDDQRPWRSGVLVGDPADPAHDPWLRAADIADATLDARLAVLAGCASAGGRELSGEGVQGLGTAFVRAGVPAVVATLWPVEDRATERFVRAFYERLARGEAAAAALRGAQRALRDARATRAPVHWAGFVLVGDPGVTVPLSPRRWPALPLAAAAMGVAALGWWLVRRRGDARGRP